METCQLELEKEEQTDTLSSQPARFFEHWASKRAADSCSVRACSKAREQPVWWWFLLVQRTTNETWFILSVLHQPVLLVHRKQTREKASILQPRNRCFFCLSFSSFSSSPQNNNTLCCSQNITAHSPTNASLQLCCLLFRTRHEWWHLHSSCFVDVWSCWLSGDGKESIQTRTKPAGSGLVAFVLVLV